MPNTITDFLTATHDISGNYRYWRREIRRVSTWRSGHERTGADIIADLNDLNTQLESILSARHDMEIVAEALLGGDDPLEAIKQDRRDVANKQASEYMEEHARLVSNDPVGAPSRTMFWYVFYDNRGFRDTSNEVVRGKLAAYIFDQLMGDDQ